MPRMRWLGLVVIVVVALLTINELRPVGAVAPIQTFADSQASPGSASPVPWPDGVQAALGAGDGVIAATPGVRPQPIASVAKVMTALVLLEAKPLQKGQAGPMITVGPEDITDYQTAKANGESVVEVQAGEQLTEAQALQGLLIPSGNNIATLLARWAYGSVDATVRHMNDRAKALGLTRTKFADVSGFSADTVSVPADLVRLGEVAMKDPVIEDVVGRPQVSLPVVGTAYNVNYALGQDGILGIKTGNIPQLGAIYLFAANQQLASGRKVTLFGVVQGLPTLDAAFSGARALLRAARATLAVRHVASRDETVGRYSLPWGGSSDVVAVEDLDILLWPGTVVRAKLEAAAVQPPVSPRTVVGKLHVTAGDGFYDLPVATVDQLYPPGRLARLTRVSW